MQRIDPELGDRARANRQMMNEAEALMWWHLRRKGLGVKFRRQHIALGNLLDFACLSLKLNVELDGSQHRDSEADMIRDAQLRAAGWTIVRFWSWDVLAETEAVIGTISRTIDELERTKKTKTS